MGGDQSTNVASHHHGNSVANSGGHENLTASSKHPPLYQGTDMTLARMSDRGETSLQNSSVHQKSLQPKPADWAQMLEVATQRRTEILMPENLENMWAKGRNYKRKENKIVKTGSQDLPTKSSATDRSLLNRKMNQETLLVSKHGKYEAAEVKSSLPSTHALATDPLQSVASTNISEYSQNPDKKLLFEGELRVDKMKDTKDHASEGYKISLKRSSSASALGIHPNQEGSSIISEFFNPEFERREGFRGKSSSDMIVRKEGQLAPKLRCRVCNFGLKLNIFENSILKH